MSYCIQAACVCVCACADTQRISTLGLLIGGGATGKGYPVSCSPTPPTLSHTHTPSRTRKVTNGPPSHHLKESESATGSAEPVSPEIHFLKGTTMEKYAASSAFLFSFSTSQTEEKHTHIHTHTLWRGRS